jgi:hypothetical protein
MTSTGRNSSLELPGTTTQTTGQIITGDYDNAELDAITQLFLKSMKNKAPLDVLPATLKEDKIMKKFLLNPELHQR